MQQYLRISKSEEIPVAFGNRRVFNKLPGILQGHIGKIGGENKIINAEFGNAE